MSVSTTGVITMEASPEVNGSGPCIICGVESMKACSLCNKVFYCGVEHQKKDWKKHKAEICRAIKEVKDDTLGNHLIATRDLKAGAHIFTDFPLIVGPTGSLPQFAKLCLDCSKVVPDNYVCSSCKWPLCGLTCEKGTNHSQNECEIFKTNTVLPNEYTTPDIYGRIFLLRFILLRSKDLTTWNQLIALESHVEARKSMDVLVTSVRESFTFIKDVCKLDGFDFELVDKIFGILHINTFEPRCLSMLPVPAEFQCEARIYGTLSKLSHQCMSNVKVTDCKNKDKKGGVSVIATVPIRKDDPLIQFYGIPEHSTRQRQRMQRSSYFFSCKCKRCTDKTELGTYYSALRCTKENCTKGFLLPLEPLDFESVWECNQEKCGTTAKWNEVDTIVKDVLNSVGHILTNYDENRDGFKGNTKKAMKFLDVLEDSLKHLSATKVHSNHSSLFPLKNCILELLTGVEMPLANPQFTIDIAEKMKTYVSECLAVYDVFFPGLTPERGKYMFYLSVSMNKRVTSMGLLQPGRSVLLSEARRCLETEKLAIEMLSGMPEGSEPHSMCRTLHCSTFATTQMIAALERC